MAVPGLWGVDGENGGMSLFSRTVDLPGVQAVMRDLTVRGKKGYK